MPARSTYRVTVLVLLGIFYLAMTQNYRAYDIDNPWFLSFSYNACHGDVQTDTFMQARYPTGMDGTHLFGKVPAAAQCAVMNHLGWTPFSIVGLNLVFALAALALWASFFHRLGHSEKWIAAFLILLGLMEPVLSMVERGRYEVFIFFFLSLAFWLGVLGWEFAAALVAMAAVECGPAGLIVPVLAALLLVFRSRRLAVTAVKFTLAVALGSAAYVAGHPHALHEMLTASYPRVHAPPGGTLFAYFLARPRHIPELIAFLLGMALLWRRRTSPSAEPAYRLQLPVTLALSVAAFLVVGLHPNPAYEVLATPFFLWLALEGYRRSRAWRWVPCVLTAGLLVQCGWLVHKNAHEGFGSREIAAVHDQIAATATALNIPDAELQICGDYSLWYAHPRNYTSCARERPNAVRGSNLFLCFDGPLMPGNLSATPSSCADISSIEPLRPMASLTVRGHLLHVEAKQ